jgi:hypothetical protein
VDGIRESFLLLLDDRKGMDRGGFTEEYIFCTDE